MPNDNLNPTITLLMYYAKYLPKSNLICVIMVVIKCIPMIIVTHDWSINNATGISYWLRHFTLSSLFSAIQLKLLYQIIVLLFFIIAILQLFIFISLRNEIIRFKKCFPISKQIIQVSAIIIYFLYYFFSQQLYSIETEIFFCPTNYTKTDNGYIIETTNDCMASYLLIINSILVGFTTLASVVFSVIIQAINYETFFISGNILMNQIGTYDNSYIGLPLWQIIIQLEYHLDFRIILIIKHVLRGLFVVAFIYDFYQHKNYFVSHTFDYIQKMMMAMCTLSCLIEWCFCFDMINNLTMLTSAGGVIIIKLGIEFLAAKVLVDYCYYREKQLIKGFIVAFSSKKKDFNELIMIKVLIILFQCKDVEHIKSITDLIQDISKEQMVNYVNNSNDATMKLDNNVYGGKFKEKDYKEQQDDFLKLITDNDIITYCNSDCVIIKKDFPLLYEFMNYYLQFTMDKSKGIKTQRQLDRLFCLMTFNLIIERNIFKCLLLVEYMKTTTFYKNSFIFRIQAHLMQKKLFSYYKKNVLKPVILVKSPSSIEHDEQKKNVLEMHMSFKSIETVRYIEDVMKDSLNDYIEIMTCFNDDDISLQRFMKILNDFKMKYDLTTLQIKALTKLNHCNIPYSPKKYDLFYSYFNEIPSESIKNAIDTFFTLESSLFQEKYSIFVIQVDLSSHRTKFNIDYVSDELKVELNYSYEEFALIGLDDVFSHHFKKTYNLLFDNMMTKGERFLGIQNFCLLDKEQYCLVYDAKSILVYAHNSVKIFLKLTVPQEHEYMEINNKNNKRNGKTGHSDKNTKPKHHKKESFKPKEIASSLLMQTKSVGGYDYYCRNCIFFTNRKGRIIIISRNFEQYFLLSPSIIAKYYINIKDIIKVEHLRKENSLSIDLNTIYNNIIQLNNCEAGQLGEDEFSKVIQQIKEIQVNMGKMHSHLQVLISYKQRNLLENTEHKVKIYYMFNLRIINAEKNNTIGNSMSPEKTFDTKLYTSLIQFNLQQSIEENDTHSPFLKVSFNNLEKIGHSNYNSYLNNKIECQNKILMVRYLSIKLLNIYFNDNSLQNAYGTKETFDKLFHDELSDTNKKKSSKYQRERSSDETPQTSFNNTTNPNNNTTTPMFPTNSNIEPRDLTDINKTYQQALGLYNIIKRKSMPSACNNWKKYTGLIIAIAISILYSFFAVSKLIQINTDFDTLYDQYAEFCVISIKMYSMLSSVLYMQFQINNLQPNTIDDHFDNSYEYYNNFLPSQLKNYLLLSGKFVAYFTDHSILDEKIDMNSISIITLPLPFVVMQRDGTKGIIKESVENISYLSMGIRQVYLNNGKVIYFNLTDTYLKEPTDFYSINENVKIIENYLGTWRYVQLELILPFEQVYAINLYKLNYTLCQILITISMFAALLSLIWMILFIRTKMALFSKYFSLFIQLRYFHILLSKKTQIILEYIMNNGDSSLNIKELIGNIGIGTDKKSNMTIKQLWTEQLNDISMIRVQAFNIQLLQLTNLSPNTDLRKSFMGSYNDWNSPNGNGNGNGNKGSLIMLHQPRQVTKPLMKKISSSQLLFNSNQTRLSESKKNIVQPIPDSSGTKIKKKAINNNDQSISSNRTVGTNKTMIRNSIAVRTDSLQSSLRHTKTSYEPIGKRLLSKPFSSLALLIFVTFALLICVMLNIFTYIFTLDLVTVVREIFETENSVFFHIQSISELLFAYQISILKNEEYLVEYTNNFNISVCNSSNANNISKHYIFDEVTQCIPTLKKEVDKISYRKVNKYLTNTMMIHNELNSKNFCSFFSSFLMEHRNHSKLIDMYSLANDSAEHLGADCERIGEGFNSEGFDIALNSMFNGLTNLYKDFRNDDKRDEESNLERLNGHLLHIMQLEFLNVIQKIPNLYLITFSDDMISLKYANLLREGGIYFANVFLLLMVNGYFLYQVFHYSNEEKLINFFDDILINTILY